MSAIRALQYCPPGDHFSDPVVRGELAEHYAREAIIDLVHAYGADRAKCVIAEIMDEAQRKKP